MEVENIVKIGELFQEYTKYRYFSQPSEMSRGIAPPDIQKPIPANAPLIDVTDLKKATPHATDILHIIDNRQSIREYSNELISFNELSVLLWATQGVKESGHGYSLRTVPSAGARHPIETYLLLNKVEDIEAGLYRFLPLNNQLVLLNQSPSLSSRLTHAALDQHMIHTSAVTFIWCAIINRSRWKYRQRAYRYIYLDAGHICQNLYLSCEALKLGCCAIAAFNDDAVNNILSVDGVEEFVIYLASVGKRHAK